MLVITSAKYASADNTRIDMVVSGWSDLPPIPFTYHIDDAAPLAVAVRDTLNTQPQNIAPYAAPASTVTGAAVDAFRDRRLAAGFADAVTGKTYQCDPLSLGKWTALGSSSGVSLAMNFSPAPNFQIITADNSMITLTTPETFALMNMRIMPWVTATVIYARNVKNQVDAGNPPADITVGWP